MTFGQQSQQPTLAKSQESYKIKGTQPIQQKDGAAQHKDLKDMMNKQPYSGSEPAHNKVVQSISTHASSIQNKFKGDQGDEETDLTENDQCESQSGKSDMIDAWQCFLCKNWMYVADSCLTCNRTLNKESLLTLKKQSDLITKMTKLQFLQLQNTGLHKLKAESKLVGEESKDEDVVMWKCPKCKVYMDFDSKCTKCGQNQRDDLVVQIKKKDIFYNEFDHIESMQDAVEQEYQPPQYWQCPTHGKIMRTDQVCTYCLQRIDQYTQIGHSQKDLMNVKEQVVVQEGKQIEPDKWHCDTCDRSISVGKFCIVCKFDQNGFAQQKCWKCPDCKNFNNADRTRCDYNKCKSMKTQQIQDELLSLWKCTKDNELVEKNSACSQCFKTKEHYDSLKKEAQVFPLSNEDASQNLAPELKPKDSNYFKTSAQSKPIIAPNICDDSQPLTTPTIEQPNQRPLEIDHFVIFTQSQSIVVQEHSQPLPIKLVEKPIQKPSNQHSEFQGQLNSIALPKTTTPRDLISENSILQPEIKPSQIPQAAARYEPLQPQKQNFLAPITFGQQSQEPTLAKSQQSQKIKGSQPIQQRVDDAQHNHNEMLDLKIQNSTDPGSKIQDESNPTHKSGVKNQFQGKKDFQETNSNKDDFHDLQSGHFDLVDAWQCSPCKKWIYLVDFCSTCKRSLFNESLLTSKKQSDLIIKMTKLKFQQLQNADAHKPKAESKLAIEESKDEDVVMWKCSKCKVYWELGSKCTKCGQNQQDDLVVQVKREDLQEDEFGYQVSMREDNEQQKQPPQFWQCPTHKKIMRTDLVCPDCLLRIDQYTEKGFSQKDLVNIKRKKKIKPGQWHCNNCDRSQFKGLICTKCKFDEKGFKKCESYFSYNTRHYWRCPTDKYDVESYSDCPKCFNSKQYYDQKAKEAFKPKDQQVTRHPSKCWVCYFCGNDKNQANNNFCENPSCLNKYGSDYFTEFWMCSLCNNKNEVDDWIKEEVAECQNYQCRHICTTVKDFIKKHQNARLSVCKFCNKEHYPQNAKDYCRPCLHEVTKCGCKYGCSQCEGYAYTKCEKCTQLKCRKGAKICRECTVSEEVSGTCQICQVNELRNGQCPIGCFQKERNKQCSMCHRYFMGKPDELCFVCRPKNQVRNATAAYYTCQKCGVNRSEPGYCANCKPGDSIFKKMGSMFF